MRKLRRIGLCAASAVLIASASYSPVFADVQAATASSDQTPTSTGQNTKLSSTDAITKVQKLFPNLATMNAAPRADLRPDPSDANRTVYDISWSPLAEPHRDGPVFSANFAHATVDANTGDILSFQNSKSSWVLDTPIKSVSAEKIANQWLNKLAPNKASQLILQPTSGYMGGGYVYLYVHKVNGVLAPFDSATIYLDATGHLTSYNFTWHEVTFPSVPGTTLSQSEASEKYAEALHLHLQYQQQFAGNSSGPMELIYVPHAPSSTGVLTPGFPIIDAFTGKTLTADGSVVSNTDVTTSVQPLVAGGPSTFPTAGKTLMTTDALEQQLRKQFGLNANDWALQGSSTQANYGGPFSAHRINQFNFVNQQTHEQLSIGADATDGVVVQYNNYGPANAQTPSTYSDDQLQQIADRFIEQAFPNLTGAIARDTNGKMYGAPDQYYAPYDLIVHGVPVFAFHVQINKSDGRIQWFGLNVDPSASFPSPDKALTVAQAEAAYIKHDGPILEYMLPTKQTDGPDNLPFQVTFGDKPMLVYAAAPLPVGPGSLDAITGKWNVSNPFGNVADISMPTNPNSVDFAIAQLEQHGMIQAGDGKVNPNTPITRAEFVQWLARCFTVHVSMDPAPQFKDVPDSNPYAADISQALMQGWLPMGDAFHPSDKLTRAQAADWLIRWMGWEGPAANGKLFQLPFSDGKSIPASELGAAAIAATDGILPTSKGKFNPNRTMTVGEAAVAVIHAIGVLIHTEQ